VPGPDRACQGDYRRWCVVLARWPAPPPDVNRRDVCARPGRPADVHQDIRSADAAGRQRDHMHSRHRGSGRDGHVYRYGGRCSIGCSKWRATNQDRHAPRLSALSNRSARAPIPPLGVRELFTEPTQRATLLEVLEPVADALKSVSWWPPSTYATPLPTALYELPRKLHPVEDAGSVFPTSSTRVDRRPLHQIRRLA
jgi:hypothetical protein